ncbi:MAG TPA: hypothetical protein PLM81_07765 [Ginsengibacter sp.]|nr:hypothetical protein [Chitinophagaceae bacterium]HRN73008.1 hypothetical protein [Ginsengibacter sp.]HRP18251.1 hypothetical protein [Ginsengibacter sp.]HRP43687.1 hypothetical protein [Ginsengibacter sp.]
MTAEEKKYCKLYGMLTGVLGVLITLLLVWMALDRKLFFETVGTIRGVTAGAVGGVGFLMIISSAYFFRKNIAKGIEVLKSGTGFLAFALLFNLGYFVYYKLPYDSVPFLGLVALVWFVKWILYRSARRNFPTYRV